MGGGATGTHHRPSQHQAHPPPAQLLASDPGAQDTQVAKLGGSEDSLWKSVKYRTEAGSSHMTVTHRNVSLTSQRNVNQSSNKVPCSPNPPATMKKSGKTELAQRHRDRPRSERGVEYVLHTLSARTLAVRALPTRQFRFKEIAKETKGQGCEDVGTLIFRAALFTVTKNWKHPKCPLIRSWGYKFSLKEH